MTGRDSTVDLAALAPEALAALAVLTSSTASADVRAAARSHSAAAAFAEQFVVDVAGVTDEQRAALTDALGAASFDFVQALYIDDFGGRVDQAWLQLFGVEPVTVDAPQTIEQWPAIEAFLPAVARLRRLDPLTTDLVRLRGARTHDCRLCRSLRNVRAVEAGAGEETFDAIDDYERGRFTERQKVALRLTDAIIWQPASYPPGLVDQVREHFTPAEVVELVLDVMRNAANKIAVALAADEAHVTSGVEYYDIDEHGELVFGLTPAN